MLPQIVHPMLAQKAETPFDSEQHLFEIKWDGIRCLAFVEDSRVRLQSRRLTEITFPFPELASLGQLPSGTLLDGELVVVHEGKPSLWHVARRMLLQNRHRIQHLSQTMPVTYMVFDLLYLKGNSLLASPLRRRRQALQNLIVRHPVPGVVVPETVLGHGRQLFAQVVRLGLEGIMAKHRDGTYLPGRRSRYWLKIKPIQILRQSHQTLWKYFHQGFCTPGRGDDSPQQAETFGIRPIPTVTPPRFRGAAQVQTTEAIKKDNHL